MRTNIVLDDDLVREAMEITGISTRKELIHRALQQLVRAERESLLREQYCQKVHELQRHTSGLKLRERPHELIRADRERR